jgi:hypothetical protein
MSIAETDGVGIAEGNPRRRAAASSRPRSRVRAGRSVPEARTGGAPGPGDGTRSRGLPQGGQSPAPGAGPRVPVPALRSGGRWLHMRRVLRRQSPSAPGWPARASAAVGRCGAAAGRRTDAAAPGAGDAEAPEDSGRPAARPVLGLPARPRPRRAPRPRLGPRRRGRPSRGGDSPGPSPCDVSATRRLARYGSLDRRCRAGAAPASVGDRVARERGSWPRSAPHHPHWEKKLGWPTAGAGAAAEPAVGVGAAAESGAGRARMAAESGAVQVPPITGTGPSRGA